MLQRDNATRNSTAWRQPISILRSRAYDRANCVHIETNRNGKKITLSLRETAMAKDSDSLKFKSAAKQALEQAHQALDAYFELLKNSVSSFPSDGTELGENLKDQGVENISALQEVVKRLSQTENFEEALRIQTAFIHSQLNVLGKQATSLGEAYTRAVKMQEKPNPEDREKSS
jgi:hypothetical protein